MSEQKHLVLVSFNWDCGRQGNVGGMFVTDKAVLEANYGKAVYFGEILGKHSEVHGTLDPQDLTIVNEDQDFLKQLVEKVGTELGGYNPLSYLAENQE